MHRRAVHEKQMPFVAGRRLSVRASKGAGVRRSLERSGSPGTEGADGLGAAFSQEEQAGLIAVLVEVPCPGDFFVIQ